MKISDIRLIHLKGNSKNDINFPSGNRQVQQMDIYPEYNLHKKDKSNKQNNNKKTSNQKQAIYVQIETEADIEGIYGPIGEKQAFIIQNSLKDFLVGKDPLAIEKLTDRMFRLDRHGRSGIFMTAISVLNCALWDLKGKVYEEPVYRLLGGPVRNEIPAYASMLGFSIEPEEAAKIASSYKEKGFTAQKWFFRYGPAEGNSGLEKNIALVEAVRNAVGKYYSLMFDAFMGWTVDYAIKMVKYMEKYDPTWMEEPLPPERIGGLKKIKESSRVPIATGEHVYTRWQAKELLENQAIDVLQVDPDWTGGISEYQKICNLASSFNTTIIAHGHALLPPLHVAASYPMTTIPQVEYLIRHQENKQYFHDPIYRPENGVIKLPQTQGLGLKLDQTKIDEKTEIKFNLKKED